MIHFEDYQNKSYYIIIIINNQTDKIKYGTYKKNELFRRITENLQDVSKRILLLSGSEILTMGEVILGVKNNSKNFENQKDIRLFSKILSKSTFFYSKFSNFHEFT